MEALAKLKGIVKPEGTVTAGNASGVNDGSCALLIASEAAANEIRAHPKGANRRCCGRWRCASHHGNGSGPGNAQSACQSQLAINQMNVIELNEAFASQGLAVLRELGVPDDAPHVNPNGGAIAIGHPLGASGARLVTTALYQLQRTRGQYALCTMCIGVGQGIAVILERV